MNQPAVEESLQKTQQMTVDGTLLPGRVPELMAEFRAAFDHTLPGAQFGSEFLLNSGGGTMQHLSHHMWHFVRRSLWLADSGAGSGAAAGVCCAGPEAALPLGP
jgi:hypothetical protein